MRVSGFPFCGTFLGITPVAINDRLALLSSDFPPRPLNMGRATTSPAQTYNYILFFYNNSLDYKKGRGNSQ